MPGAYPKSHTGSSRTWPQASALASGFLRRSRRGPERCDLPHLRMLCERHQQISNPTLANFGKEIDRPLQAGGVEAMSNRNSRRLPAI